MSKTKSKTILRISFNSPVVLTFALICLGAYLLNILTGGKSNFQVEALNLGANDYVTKPFGSEELVARVRSALRTVLYQAHDSELPTGKFQTGDLLIDYEARRVFIGDEEIKLTQTEYNIVDLLSRHPGKMLTYSFIVKEVWGYNDMGSTKRLQVNMANIRKKFGVKPGKKSFIINELGVGYRMCDDSEKLIDSI